MMKPTLFALSALCATAAFAPVQTAAAQVAGHTTLGVTVEEMKLVVLGWSAKRKLLDHAVFNDKNERLGKVDDIIVSPTTRTVSWAILGVGGFLGIAKKDVAIPTDQLKIVGDRFVLAGATKDVVKAMPAFEYVK
jgi:sporulation protein YlmC with PRC-barrel domain